MCVSASLSTCNLDYRLKYLDDIAKLDYGQYNRVCLPALIKYCNMRMMIEMRKKLSIKFDVEFNNLMR